MSEKYKDRLKRFHWFSVILNVKGGENIKWEKLSSEKIHEKLVKYEFPTPKRLRDQLMSNRFISSYSAEKKNIRYFEIDELKGQLEQGEKNGRPHYNLILRTTSPVRCSDLARELSLGFFNVKNDKSIQVNQAYNPDALKIYCLKEDTRLELLGTEYYPPKVDNKDYELDKNMENDSDLLKILKNPLLFQEQIFDMIESPAEARKIQLLFEPKGGMGKTKLSKLIDLLPNIKAILAPSLSESSDRWSSAFYQQITEFRKEHGCFPKAVIFDLTKAEDFGKLTSMYSLLEHLKDGRVESLFYGQFKRLWMTNPHVIVLMNTVPSTNLLSEDRFDFHYISQRNHGGMLLKCRVNLGIVHMNRGLVTWEYSANVEPAEVQFQAYEKILQPKTMDKLSKALSEVDSSIYTRAFKGARRTTPVNNAPEYVQEAICFMPTRKELIDKIEKDFNLPD